MQLPAKVYPYPTNKDAAIIYCHYNYNDMCARYVLRQLKALRAFFKWRVFVSNSFLTKPYKQKIEALGFDVLIRDNIGYDFGAWRDGYHHVQAVKNIKRFYFMNDSCLGPLPGFSDIIQNMLNSKEDLVALSSNTQIRYHVQTVLFGLQNRAVETGFCDQFWNAVKNLENKTDIIHRYEIGLTQMAQKTGLSVSAFYEGLHLTVLDRLGLSLTLLKAKHIRTILKHGFYLILNARVNPFHLDQKMGVPLTIPLIKKEIIQKNPFDLDIERFINELHRKCPETAQDAQTLKLMH